MGISNNVGSEMLKYLQKMEILEENTTFPNQFLISLYEQPHRNWLHIKSRYYINCLIFCLWTFCASYLTLAKGYLPLYVFIPAHAF